MAKTKISIDEFLTHRKGAIDAIGHVQKGIIVPEPEDLDEAAKASRKFDPKSRSARFIMSTETPDRDEDIIRQAGWVLDNFLKNPVAPLFHVMRSWPVGSWKDVETNLGGRPKRLEGTFVALPEGGPVPEVDQAAWMLENGGLRAVSVGFMPLELEYRDPEQGWFSGFDIVAAELYECSLVTVPANPEALIKNAGGDMRLAKELVEHVLDVYAVDPRTGSLIDRKALEEEYKKFFGDRYVMILNVARAAGKQAAPALDIDALAEKLAVRLTPKEAPVPPTPGVISPAAPDPAGPRPKGPAITAPSSPQEKEPPLAPKKAPSQSWMDRIMKMAGIEPRKEPEPDPSTKIVPGSAEKARERFEQRSKQLQE